MSDQSNMGLQNSPPFGKHCRGQSIVSDGLGKVSGGADVSATHEDVKTALTQLEGRDNAPVCDAQIAEAEADLRAAEDEKKSNIRKRKATKAYVKKTEAVPFREISFAHLLEGGLSFFVLTALFFMIPIVGAATVAESTKIPLFADAQILAALYAAMGMSGAIGMAFLRSRFDTDHSRKRYDFVIIAITILAVLNFIIGLAFSAFPPGSDALARGGLFDPVPETADHWSYPAWGLVLSGAVLEICAGGLLSAVISSFIRPRRVVGILPNPERAYLDETLIPASEVRCETALVRLQALKADRAAFEDETRGNVDHWLALFDRLATQIRRDRLEALENAQHELGADQS